jgi:hypothetical protein
MLEPDYSVTQAIDDRVNSREEVAPAGGENVMIQTLSDADLWAQALALESLLGKKAADYLFVRTDELEASGDEVGAEWMRSMHQRLERLSDTTARA